VRGQSQQRGAIDECCVKWPEKIRDRSVQDVPDGQLIASRNIGSQEQTGGDDGIAAVAEVPRLVEVEPPGDKVLSHWLPHGGVQECTRKDSRERSGEYRRGPAGASKKDGPTRS